MKRILLAVVAAYLITGCAAKAPIQTPDSRVYSDVSSSFPVITRESDKRRAMNTRTIDILTKVMSGEVPEQGNATGAGNARVRTDSNGYLMAAGQTYVGPDGPLTNFGNIRVRTDTNGYLMVALAGGSVTGPFQINADGIAVVSTDGAVLSNATAATSGVPQQNSPRLKWCGTGYNSSSMLSEVDCYFVQVEPSTAAGATGPTLNFYNNSNGGAFTSRAALTSGGNWNALGNIQSGGISDIKWNTSTTFTSQSDGVLTLWNFAKNDFGRLQFGGTTSSFPSLKRNVAGLDLRLADDSSYGFFSASGYYANSAQMNLGANTSGITTQTLAQMQTATYKATAPFTMFIAAATTMDIVVAQLPAKTFISAMVVDLTQTFACASVCTTSTLSMTCGKTAGGAEYVVSFDADAATGQFGASQATIGTALKYATPPVALLGDLGSWSTTTNIQCRMTSGTGNIGTGAATNFSQGSITFYIITTRMP